MSDKKTDAEVAAYIEMEGLGYAVQYGLCADQISNKALATLWQAAADALNSIEDLLQEYLEEFFEDVDAEPEGDEA